MFFNKKKQKLIAIQKLSCSIKWFLLDYANTNWKFDGDDFFENRNELTDYFEQSFLDFYFKNGKDNSPEHLLDTYGFPFSKLLDDFCCYYVSNCKHVKIKKIFNHSLSEISTEEKFAIESAFELE
jgi:hypothetical protein